MNILNILECIETYQAVPSVASRDRYQFPGGPYTGKIIYNRACYPMLAIYIEGDL